GSGEPPHLLKDDVLTVSVRANTVVVQVAGSEMHSENKHRDQTEIQDRHRPALGGCDFIIPALFLGAFTEERINARQGSDHYQPDNEVRIFTTKQMIYLETGQPKSERERGDN